MSRITVAFVALLSLGSAWAAGDSTCKTMFDVIASTPETSYFGAALQASGLAVQTGQQYTILAPNNDAFGSLLIAYGFETPLTPETIRANENANRLAGFLKYYVIGAKYSAADLVAKSATQNMKTLYDPAVEGQQVCREPNSADDGTIKPSDGDLKFAMSGADVTVTDDSTTTDLATITTKDVPACEGFVQIMNKVINPCAPDVPATSSGKLVRAAAASLVAALVGMMLVL